MCIIQYKAPIVIEFKMDQKVTPQYMSLKAGMNSVNSEAIGKKIAEMTKGTPKDLHEKQLQRKRAVEVALMLEKVLKFTAEQKSELKSYWKKKIDEKVTTRPLDRYWAHFDFDMFYVACELLDKPEMRNLPCAVGGDNSVLCTANYIARLHGVRAAMPTFIAKNLCPQLNLFKPNFHKYHKFSAIFKEILSKYDQNLESHGLDEAYVEITPYLSHKTRAQQQQFIKQIREQVFEKTGLTVSCGVGANKMLAKMASEIQKPNDQYIIANDHETIMEFMREKKIRKIPGIGPVNQFYLKGLHLEQASDILQHTDILTICFSDQTCQFFIDAALGLGCIEHEFKQRKSIGKSQTFRPTNDENFITSKLKSLCQEVTMELEELDYLTLSIVISYQSQNYEKKDRSIKMDKYTTSSQVFYEMGIKYVKEEIIQKKRKIRLLGVRCTQIIKKDEWKRKTLQSHFAKEKIKVRYEGDEEGEKRAMLLQEIREACEYICPICNTEVQCYGNLALFNRHVDKCLSVGPTERSRQLQAHISTTKKQQSFANRKKEKNIERSKGKNEEKFAEKTKVKGCEKNEAAPNPKRKEQNLNNFFIKRS